MFFVICKVLRCVVCWFVLVVWCLLKLELFCLGWFGFNFVFILLELVFKGIVDWFFCFFFIYGSICFLGIVMVFIFWILEILFFELGKVNVLFNNFSSFILFICFNIVKSVVEFWFFVILVMGFWLVLFLCFFLFVIELKLVFFLIKFWMVVFVGIFGFLI